MPGTYDFLNTSKKRCRYLEIALCIFIAFQMFILLFVFLVGICMQVPVKDGKGCQISRSWLQWQLKAIWILGTGSGLLEEEQVLLTAEPSLQIHMALFCIHFHRSLHCNMSTQPASLRCLLLHPNLSSCSLTMLVSTFMPYVHP